jgi:hypothetical protein
MKWWDAPKGTRPEQRFWARTRRPESETTPDQCWLYMGPQTKAGYGRITVDGVCVFAHRYAYELLVGPIPEGKHIDHVKARGCTHHNCVNPAHLEPVTRRENILRGDSPAAKNARKTHCPKGHAYDDQNTYVRADGERDCRTCKRANDARRNGPALSREDRLTG